MAKKTKVAVAPAVVKTPEQIEREAKMARVYKLALAQLINRWGGLEAMAEWAARLEGAEIEGIEIRRIV